MQTDAFQLNAFQQDGGQSTLFSLEPTAAVGLSGSLSVAGALATEVSLSGSVALTGALSLDGALGTEVGISGSVALSGALTVTGDVLSDIEFSLEPTAAVGLSGALSASADFRFGTEIAETGGGWPMPPPRKKKKQEPEPEFVPPQVIEVVVEKPRRKIIKIEDLMKPERIEAMNIERAAIERAKALKKRKLEEDELLLMM